MSFAASRITSYEPSRTFPFVFAAPENNNYNYTAGVEVDINALVNATIDEAGPLLLRILQSKDFHDYAIANGVAPAGNLDLFEYGLVKAPTNSPVCADISQADSSDSSKEKAATAKGVDLERGMLAYLRSLAIVESLCGGGEGGEALQKLGSVSSEGGKSAGSNSSSDSSWE